MVVRDACCFSSLFHVCNIDLNEFLAAIFDGPDTDHGSELDDCSTKHGRLKVLRVVFRKSSDLLLEYFEFRVGSGFESFEALSDIGEETGLRELPVGNNIDPAFGLLADRLGHR